MSDAEKAGYSSWILWKCAMRTGSGLCQSPEHRLQGARTESTGQKTLHQAPVHDGCRVRLTGHRAPLFFAPCGALRRGLGGCWHVLLGLAEVANHDPFGVETDRVEEVKKEAGQNVGLVTELDECPVMADLRPLMGPHRGRRRLPPRCPRWRGSWFAGRVSGLRRACCGCDWGALPRRFPRPPRRRPTTASSPRGCCPPPCSASGWSACRSEAPR